MQRKSRACFASHDEWLAYVRRELDRDEQLYALAYGRMELFQRFLELRGQSLPAELKAELDPSLGSPIRIVQANSKHSTIGSWRT